MKQYDDTYTVIDGYPNYITNKEGTVINRITGRVLKTGDNNSGYPTVNLYNNGKRETKSIHRIVAKTFVDGYRDGMEVNHKDGDKHNNHIDNLEWMSHSENELHAYQTGLKHGPNRRAVRVIESGEVFESINECARAIGGCDANIGRCLHGRQNNHRGLTFEFADACEINAKADGNSVSVNRVNRKHYRKSVRIVETGEVFSSVRECARAIGGDQGTISACLSGRHHTHKGYHYEFV